MQSSAKYSCNEIPLYFVDDGVDKANGKMMLNGKMQDVIVGMYDKKLYIDKKIYKKNVEFVGDDVENIISPKCIYDVDQFKVELTEKEKRKIGTQYNILTFNKVEEDTGEKIAENYLKNSAKLKKKYAAGYELKRTRVNYSGYVENGKLFEHRAFRYKVNGRDEYQVYIMKEEGQEWQVAGSICLNAKYVSDESGHIPRMQSQRDMHVLVDAAKAEHVVPVILAGAVAAHQGHSGRPGPDQGRSQGVAQKAVLQMAVRVHETGVRPVVRI